MRLRISLVTLAAIALCVVSASFLFFRDVVIETRSVPVIIQSMDHQTGQGIASFEVDAQLAPGEQYVFCFRYNTTGIASPFFTISTKGGAHPIRVALPRNSWGLGDACFTISPRSPYPDSVIAFGNSGSASSLTIYHWSLSRAKLPSLQLFGRAIQSDDAADIYLNNSYLRPAFVAPFGIFVFIWLGAGWVVSTCISGLTKWEVICVAPVTGTVVVSFVAYFLGLVGIYDRDMFIILTVLLVGYVAYVRKRTACALRSPAIVTASEQVRPFWSLSGGWGDIVAAALIAYMMSKYLLVAATPFYDTWDGLVSWNKWGMDWAAREIRGNYQFTYPQMIPLLYSAYYKIANHSASDPLGLPMTGAHLFVTYLGLLALPLLYLCSKALKISPIIPVSVVLLSGGYFSGINNGFVDNTLVTYYLACALIILRASTVRDAGTLHTVLVIGMLGAGAIFLKQTGIFVSLAVLMLLLVHYREVALSRAGLLGLLLVAFVPTEFYVHELVLNMYPALVEDNPHNHSIGGVLSNAGTQLQLTSTTMSAWYTKLAGKLLSLSGHSFPPPSLGATLLALAVTLAVLAGFAKVAIALYRAKNWRVLAVWLFMVGGQLVIAAKFGGVDEKRYVLFLVPVLAILIGLYAQKLMHLHWRMLSFGSVLAALFAIGAGVTLAFSVRYPALPAASSGYDSISFEERLKRFYHPAHSRVANYLVSQKNQDFQFFTESDFVVWPNTIYDSFTKSTPTKMSKIYRTGDYWYSVIASTCQDGFERVQVDVGAFVFCRKK